MRLFYAIDLPDDIKRPIAECLPELRKLGHHIRPVRESGMHLTLLFLGEMPESVLPDLSEYGTNAVAAARPCRLEIGPVGFFPRVSFLTLTGEIETLILVSSVLADTCSGYLEKPETRPFKAHVTLARHKQKIRSGEKDRIKGIYSQFQGLSWIADELVLYESELTSKGAIYTAIERFKFGSG